MTRDPVVDMKTEEELQLKIIDLAIKLAALEERIAILDDLLERDQGRDPDSQKGD